MNINHEVTESKESNNYSLNQLFSNLDNYINLIKEEQEQKGNITRYEKNLKGNYKLNVKEGDLLTFGKNKVFIEKIEANKICYIIEEKDNTDFNFELFGLYEDNIDKGGVIDGGIAFRNSLFGRWSAVSLVDTLLSKSEKIHYGEMLGQGHHSYFKSLGELCDNNVESLKKYIEDNGLENANGINAGFSYIGYEDREEGTDFNLGHALYQLEDYFKEDLPKKIEEKRELEDKIKQAELKNNEDSFKEKQEKDLKKAEELSEAIKNREENFNGIKADTDEEFAYAILKKGGDFYPSLNGLVYRINLGEKKLIESYDKVKEQYLAYLGDEKLIDKITTFPEDEVNKIICEAILVGDEYANLHIPNTMGINQLIKEINSGSIEFKLSKGEYISNLKGKIKKYVRLGGDKSLISYIKDDNIKSEIDL